MGEKLDLGFSVKAVRGNVVNEVQFCELLVRRTIVSVYMKNNTPSCDRQLASLAAHAAEFARAGFGVIAISRDPSGSQLRYARARGIGFTLVSDPQDHFAQAAGALVEKSMYGRRFIGPMRAAYVLDSDGAVLALAEKVDTSDHAAQLRKLINEHVQKE